VIDGVELAATAVHHACESLSPEPPHRRLLLVRARAYQVAVQFPKELVRSDRRARAAARAHAYGQFSSYFKLYTPVRVF
jgi:hypothetical protein